MQAQFQFHKGTIRTLKFINRSSVGSEFQFHKGTIRTGAAVGGLAGGVPFQFHKGTIRTCKIENCYLLIYDFNSIKVRLEHFTTAEGIYAALFQFHKGTIRTS